MRSIDSLVARLHSEGSVFRLYSQRAGKISTASDDSWRELEKRGLKVWQPPDETKLPILLVRGEIPQASYVAVVGSRAVDPYGRACARKVARLVIDLGFHVLSGGAEGCDAQSHRVSLELGSPTVVVLGHGHDHTYPSHHRGLFDEVVRGGGAIVSPYWPTISPRAYRFRERNQVIARLSKAVVVVRARARSGSLSTAMFARQIGRPVLAIPSNVGQSLGYGCNELLATGAIPLIGPDQLAKTLGVEKTLVDVWASCERGSPSPWKAAVSLPRRTRTPEESLIISTLKSDTILDLDTLHMRSGLTVAKLSACLLNLEVQGVVQKTESDEYFIT